MVTIPLVGEPLALDLVNTVFAPPSGDEVDLLDSHDGLAAWIALQADRLAPPSDVVDLAPLRALRAQVGVVVEHARSGSRPPSEALEALTAAPKAAPPYREVSWQRGAATVTERRDGDATAVLLAELAEAAIDLISDPRVRDVRCCAGPRCRLLFLPTHPRRQWCSPTLCGNRARAARYYERHRSTS